MAVCVSPDVNGVLSVSPSAVGSCVDYVLYTATEYAALTPLYTPEDIVLISTGVVSAWAVAWGLKIVRRAF